MTFNRTFTAALFAFSLITVAGAAQAQTFAWEENISSSPVLEQAYTNTSSGPLYSVTFDETFGN